MTKARLAALTVVGALASVALYLVWLHATLPGVGFLATENPGETSLMRERGGERAQHWAPLASISERLVEAVLASEDAGFYYHDGFDLYEMREALERNWEEGRTVRGASTITQQLAKNLFLGTERTYGRKLKEAFLTYRLESALPKNRILELYLNVIEWGDGVYGAEAAARTVFGKPAAHLDAGEAALLAAMIPNPRSLDPCERPKSVRTRQARILGWMRSAGHLSDEEHDAALAERIPIRGCGLFPPPEG